LRVEPDSQTFREDVSPDHFQGYEARFRRPSSANRSRQDDGRENRRRGRGGGALGLGGSGRKVMRRYRTRVRANARRLSTVRSMELMASRRLHDYRHRRSRALVQQSDWSRIPPVRRGEGRSELVRSFDPAGEETVFFPRVTIWQSSNVLQMCHGATRNEVTRNASGQRKQRWPANGPLAARKSWPLSDWPPRFHSREKAYSGRAGRIRNLAISTGCARFL
jgi:hypothetical protein